MPTIPYRPSARAILSEDGSWTYGSDADEAIRLTHGSYRAYAGAGDDVVRVEGHSSWGYGEAGDDVLVLAGVNGVATGGAGADTFVIGAGGSGRVTDFEAGVDAIAFERETGIASLAALTVAADGADTLVSWQGGSLRLEGVAPDALGAILFEGWDALDLPATEADLASVDGSWLYGTGAAEDLTLTHASFRAYAGGGDDVVRVEGHSAWGYGEAGADALILSGENAIGFGGAGADTFVLGGAQAVAVGDFEAGVDRIAFGGAAGVGGLDEVRLVQDGADAVLSWAGGQATLRGVEAGTLSASDFLVTEPDAGPPEPPQPPEPPEPPQPPEPPEPPEPPADWSATEPDRAPGALPALILHDVEGRAGRVVTVGHAFEKGAVPAGEGLVGLIGGEAVAIQVDAKRTWSDGSLKHGVLTFVAPEAAEGASMALALGDGPSGGVPDLAGMAADAGLVVEIDGSTLDVGAMLAEGGEAWLDGPLVSEARVSAVTQQGVRVAIDVRAKADGEVDATVSAVWGDVGAVGNINTTYDVAIVRGGATVMAEEGFTHRHHGAWHVRADGAPAPWVAVDAAYMARAGVLPSYDTALDGRHEALFESYLGEFWFDPMGPGNMQTGMGTGGGRPDIGPLPDWTALYLLDQTAESRAVVLGNGAAAGSVPWHLIDPDTGAPVRAGDASNDGMGWAHANWGAEALSVYSDGYELEVGAPSHKPSLAAVPYLVTGERFYLDEMEAEVAYDLFARNPGRTTEMRFEPRGQLRGQAWLMRDLFLAAELAPDGEAADYYADVLDEHLQGYVDFYVLGLPFETEGYQVSVSYRFGGTELEGVLRGNDSGAWADGINDGLNSPVEQDMFGLVIGMIAKAGNAKAKALGEWMAGFSAGRFLQDDFDARDATGKRLQDDSNDPGADAPAAQPHATPTTWAELNAQTQESYFANDRHLDDPAGEFWPVIAKASMASLFSGTGAASYAEAYLWLAHATKDRVANYESDDGSGGYVANAGSGAQWGVLPAFADGTMVALADHHFGTGEREVWTLGAANEAAVGGAGRDVIRGRQGHDLIDGGADRDVLHGHAGDDWVFGGEGDDVISGGTGTNWLQGDRADPDFARGADTFVFWRKAGETTIADFEAGRDVLRFRRPELAEDAQDVWDALRTDGEDALLDFGERGTIRLKGVDAGTLDEGDLLFG